MQKLINLKDYLLSDHAANNMIRILKYTNDCISNMTQDEIMDKFSLKTDLEYYQFMVDIEGFRDSYIDFSLRFQTEVDLTSGRNKNFRKAVTNMGYTKKEKTASAEAEVKKITLDEIEVRRAGVVNDTTVGFDLTIRGIGISGFYIRICKDKNGEEFKVISKPSKKGKDGKYYDQVFIPGFTKDIQEAIIEKVESLL